MKKSMEYVLVLAALLIMTGWGAQQKAWYDKYPAVCHALGMAKGGETLTNSREALEYNYKRGQKVFETDLAITADNVVVLRHDWFSDLGQAENLGWTEGTLQTPASDQFLSALLYGKYTPMTLLDLYKFMDKKKDVYVVLDSKYSNTTEEDFTLIVDTALQNGLESVLDRIIVQLYYEQMYDEVESVYHFKNYIYTLYYIGWPGGEAVGSFCQDKNIPVVVMPYDWLSKDIVKELEAYPVEIYVHTVNAPSDAEYVTELGADGVYTDVFLPRDMKALYKQMQRKEVSSGLS